MIRSWSRLGAGNVPPGAIMAVTPGLPPLVIQNRATVNFRMVRRVYATGDNKIAVEFDADMPAAWETGSEITVRVYGADGATHRAHRANNWTGGPFVDVVTLEPVPLSDPNGVYLGGDPWEIERLDDRTAVLVGSVYKVNSTDPDPVFLCGHAYTDEVDAWPAFVQAHAYIEGRPYSRIVTGDGVFMILRNGGDLSGSSWPANTSLEMPAFSTIEGSGPNTSIICRGDYFNCIPFRFFDSKVTVQNIGQIGDAMFQKLATHGWKATAESETRSITDVTYRNVWNWMIPGYCFNNGKPGGKIRIRYEGIKCFGNTNDVADHKGDITSNIDGAYGGSIDDIFAISCGMGTVGNNKQLPITLTTANPIGITNGSADFTVALPFKPYIGQRITLDANTPAAGNFTFASKGFTVKARGGTGSRTATCSYDGTTLASASTGSYGGTGRSVLAPSLNKGKPLMDIRGEGWRISNAEYVDVFGYSTGFRVRGGDGTNNNGRGGHRSVVMNYIARSTSTVGDDTDGEAFKGAVIDGNQVQFTNFVISGVNKGIGLSIGSDADGSVVKGIIRNVATGVSWASNDVAAELTIDGCDTQVNVDGGQGDVSAVVDNALSVTSGSSIVTVAWADAPASLTTGKSMSIAGAQPIGGLINTSGTWVITKVSTGIFTFDSLQTATETTTDGGGEGILLTALNVATPNSGNTLKLISRNCTGTVLNFTNRVEGFRVPEIEWDGSGTAAAYDTTAVGIIYGPISKGWDCALPFSRLPDAGDVGDGTRAMVSDADTTDSFTAVAGGGVNTVPVISIDGEWRVAIGPSGPNLLPGGGVTFPREASFRISDGARVYRGGASYGTEDFDDNTTFQSYVDADGQGLRIIYRDAGDATKRWNMIVALPTNQMANLAGRSVCLGFTERGGSGMVADVTAEILETVEMGAWAIYDDDGYYPSGNNIVETLTFTPGEDAVRRSITGTLSADAMSCAVRFSGDWVDCTTGADLFLSNLHFGAGTVAPQRRGFLLPERLNEAMLYNRTTYAHGVPPGQPDTLAGSMLARVVALDGSNLGCVFNWRYETLFTPRIKTYSPVSGDVGGCYNETTGVDDIPITLADVTNTGVTAYFSRTTSVAVGDKIRVHIEAEV